MSDFKSAFEKAGIPVEDVSFAAACRDLARLALNREADPHRAAAVWIGMASGPQFRAALEQFIATVGKGQIPRSERVEGRTDACNAHPGDAPALSEHGLKSDGVDQDICGDNAQTGGVPPSDPLSGSAAPHDDAGPIHCITHARSVPSSGNQSRLSATMAARERSVRAMSGFYITERARAEAEGLIVAPAGSIPKKRQAEYRSLGHIDSRARRYMEKRLICDLWRAWRRATNSDDRADQRVTGPIEAQVHGVPLSSELAQQAA